MRILVSGASIAGPVLAYWLTRHGFEVTVVERADTLRKTGGHAVDLFRPAMEITERMGVLDRARAHATGAERMTVHGRRCRTRVDFTRIYGATSDRHLEIMRDDLSEIYFDAGRDDVEYLFGDTITDLSPGGEVTFQRCGPRRFDLVIGADGLHSNVRRLVFGDESALSTYLGAYLAVLSLPRSAAAEGEIRTYVRPGLLAACYTAAHLPDARAVFLFSLDTPLGYHHHDVESQKAFLRKRFAGLDAEVDGWLEELPRTAAFYFDSVTQLRLDSWSRGRVALVGDAAYCPGPAVGGSTTLAVVGAHTLATELARAEGDHTRAFAAYDRAMADPVRRSRAFARRAVKTLVPRTRAGVLGLTIGMFALSRLPTPVGRTVAHMNGAGLSPFDSMRVAEYP